MAGRLGEGGQEYHTSKALYSRKRNFCVPSITPPLGSLHPTLLCPYHQRMLLTDGWWEMLSTCPDSASSAKNSRSLVVRVCVVSTFQCPFSQLLYPSPRQHVNPHFFLLAWWSIPADRVGSYPRWKTPALISHSLPLIGTQSP